MKKYIAGIKCEWDRMLVYRFDIFSYRVGNFIEILVQLLIWGLIYQETAEVFGYSYTEMVSYVLIGYLFYFLTTSYNHEAKISRLIQDGSLSNMICKPIDWLMHVGSIAIGKLYVTFFFSIVMQFIIIALYYKYIILPESIASVLLVLAMLVVGYFIRLLLSLIVGMIAFWTVHISGIQYSVGIFIKFFSGAYFSLFLLPPEYLKVALAMPFAYTFYVPVQLYLGKLSLEEGLFGLLVSVLWLVAIVIITKIVFKRGLKKYEAVGA